MFLILMEVLVSIILISELAIPAILGTKFFPLIRGAFTRRKIVEVNTKIVAEEMNEELREKEAQLKKKTSKRVQIEEEMVDESILQDVENAQSELLEMKKTRKRKRAQRKNESTDSPNFFKGDRK